MVKSIVRSSPPDSPKLPHPREESEQIANEVALKSGGYLSSQEYVDEESNKLDSETEEDNDPYVVDVLYMHRQKAHSVSVLHVPDPAKMAQFRTTLEPSNSRMAKLLDDPQVLLSLFLSEYFLLWPI